jgi:hypothetical protein
MQIFEPDPGYHLGGMLGRVTFDPWIAMLAAGALGHQLHIAFLLKLGFWQFVLICIILQALWPSGTIGKYRIKDN